MRIVIVTPEYPPHAGGGIAKYYALLSAALVRLGNSVDVVVSAPFSDDVVPYTHDGVRVHCVLRRDIDRRSQRMAHLSSVPVLRRWLAAARGAFDAAMSLNPDAIETTDFGLTFAPFVVAGLTTPVLVQCHGSLGQISMWEPRRPEAALDHALARFVEATLLPFAPVVMTYGAPNAREWSERLGRPVVVEPPPFVCAERPTGPRQGALVVGRIQSWKGPEVLARALKEVPAQRLPRVEWIGRDTDSAPGGGSLDAWLRRTYPDVWGSRVDPVGPRSHDAVIASMSRARIVVVPSNWDVFNFTAVEAMSAACVVLCSDGAGAGEHIEHGVTGFRFRPGDSAALADALMAATALTPDTASAMGEAARATVSCVLDPDAVAARRAATHASSICGQSNHSATVPDWIRMFVEEHESSVVDLAFLDQLPLRDLTDYVGRRAAHRALSRVAMAGLGTGQQ